MTITKANLVEKVSNRLGLSKADSQNLVENFFTDLKSIRKNGRRRYYRYDEIKIISTIKDLIFNQGLSIKGAQAYLDNLNKNVNTVKSKSLYKERIQDIINVLKA